MTTAVYALRFTGSCGDRYIWPAYLHRRDATAAKEAQEADWRAFKESGRGSIFGHLTIERIEVQGDPQLMLTEQKGGKGAGR